MWAAGLVTPADGERALIRVIHAHTGSGSLACLPACLPACLSACPPAYLPAGLRHAPDSFQRYVCGGVGMR